MQQYIFRGKRVDNGQWGRGSLVSTSPEEAFILIGVTGHIKRDDYECYMVPVKPETVGIYIGRNDKDHNKIFTGDLLKVIDKDKKDNVIEGVTLVRWNSQGNKYEGCFFSPKGWIENGLNRDAGSLSMYTVIGNIWDNPELVKTTAQEQYSI